ncbi:MAG TPA: restriction endonuclease subunit S [Candidatus Faeciplasma pullistercoris]|uniref:Restriction endonuclease subunit S n=1 Tax=Candidatus Faeciplasma pullistercoris TaxID=2840800 RepID=A0A9D1GUJ2_9FIRM|nr:restriction endonuclease subunit S [Candidatus Faeciplasma pullistercoris]
MTPQELKNSILQLAIQGKLVEQRPEEGTAEELFKVLQEKRKELLSAGKIYKKKPTKPFYSKSDLDSFAIPETWLWVQLGDVSLIQEGAGIRKWQYRDSGIQILCVTNILDGAVDLTKKELYISEEEYNEKYLHLTLNNGDIVTACSGGSWGKVAIFNSENTIMLNTSTLRMRFWGDICCNKFLYYVCQSQFFKKQLQGQLSGMQPNFGYAHYSRIVIPLPPLAEQKRIVAKIEELLPLVDRYEQAWSKLEQFNSRFPEDMKKSLLQYAIQGKLVEQRPEEGTAEELFVQIQEEKQRLIAEKKIKKEKPLPEITDDEKPFDIPDSWKWVRVQEITCLNPKNDLPDELETSFIPMALVDDGYRNHHSFEIKTWGDIKKGFTHFANGDIGIAKITPCFQNRKSVVFRNLKNGYGAGTTELSIVRVVDDLLSRDFLLWFFKSAYFIENGVKSFTGTAGQQRIHKDYLATCVFPLPPLAEQKRIVEKLEQLLPLCARLN